MKTAKIGELVDAVTTWNPSRSPDVEFEYIDLSAVDNGSKAVVGPATVIGAEAPSRARQLVSAGDVLVSTVRPNLNAVAVVPAELDGATASTGFTVLRPSKELDGRFLFHWVQSPAFVEDMVRKATGASYPAVSDRIVKDSAIPAPPLTEQRRIAAILDHADALRTRRRQVLTHLDALSRSNFKDLFATHRPTEVNLGNVATFYGGTSLPAGRPFGGQETGTLLMKVSDMNIAGNEERVLATTLWTDSITAKAATVAADAIVLPKRGASIATNKKRITTRTTALDPNLMGVQPLPDLVEARYLFAWFQSFDLATITSGSTVPQLNKQDLAPLRIPLPPLDVQRGFTAREAQIDAQRAAAQRALTSNDELFACLQSHAFRGEL